MARSAPRYDPRIVRALGELDDPRQPMAETCRRVGLEAERLRLKRPSYVHVRRLLRAERRRREAERLRREGVRTVVVEAAADLIAGRYVDPYDLVGRLHEAAGAPEGEFVALSHKLE